MDERCFYYKKLINEYLNNTINNIEMLSLMEHLDVCISCKRDFETLKEISSLSKKIKKIKSPEDFSEKLREKIKGKKNKQSRLTEILLISAASIVLFLAGFLISSNYVINRNSYVNNKISENEKISIPVKKEIHPGEIKIKNSDYKKWEKVYLEEVSH